MKKRVVTVRGKRSEWGIPTYASDEAVSDWEADGLEVITPLYEIPEWIVGAGLLRPYCILIDLWNLRNPWAK